MESTRHSPINSQRRLYIIEPAPESEHMAICCVYNSVTQLYDRCAIVPEAQINEWIRRVKERGGFVDYPFN
jgi:hypothetical protein